MSEIGAAHRLLNVTEAAQRLGVSVSFLNKARLTGDGPIFVKIGTRVAYDPADPTAWLDAHKRQSTQSAREGRHERRKGLNRRQGVPAMARRRRSPAKVDFGRVNAAALGNAEGVVRGLLPDGRRDGAEWVARNPQRPDRRLGSFKVNLNSGKWADFATGDRGGDLVSLAAFVGGVG